MALQDLSTQLGFPVVVLILLLIWSLIWKGFALWKAVKRHQLIWFVALLIINTFGILEILYIFIFSKLGLKDSKTKKNKK